MFFMDGIGLGFVGRHWDLCRMTLCVSSAYVSSAYVSSV